MDIHCLHWQLEKPGEKGCSWVGQVKHLGAHLEICGYVLIVCPLSCIQGERFFQKDLDLHSTTECVLRKVVCEHCGVKGTYQWMMENHYYQCEKITVPCVNGCGQNLSRNEFEVQQHSKVCTHAVIECPFAKVGCEVQVIRLKMAQHQHDSIHLHLLYTMQSLQSEREKNELE